MNLQNSLVCAAMIFCGFVVGIGINVNTLASYAADTKPYEVRVLHQSGVKCHYEIISVRGQTFIINYEGDIQPVS